ncbi:protein of unknown function DUF1385 [Rubrobacter xylanophilus DSM 9941]|uniref:DUF1385 domain-containing protein n=1 Tax=Rubrobacter xylanophilus (strain DSM 9941 / JCM 11954 / NBRC 16129 / PRD-1) TaxID=266117 RepID=Q1AVG4_RUBXD|nr:DUF1385 domain-containing protein [Rubrobacter xylanophilus]ABG04614.1 protein of unknown function DUF1385 [Rubrobacter xylanophilus DSM 9941]
MRVGGQAVMEGVLMRSPNFWGMAVRTPEGELDLRAERFRSITRRSRLFRLPVVRGFLSLAETLWLGMRALTISTNIALGEDEELSKKEIAATLLFALALGVALFLVAPVLGTKGLGSLVGGIEHPVLFNLVEGVIRVAIFIAYLLVITAASRDIKRFFAYHGAEHKAIKVYERGEELVPENARRLDTSHVRCGTSFILYVLVLSILVFSLLGVEGWLYMVASRVVVIPLVAGLAFEFIMWSARHQDNALVRALVWPGLQLQRLTTREPTDEMVEVAMASLKKVLAMEEEARIRPDETSKLVI